MIDIMKYTLRLLSSAFLSDDIQGYRAKMDDNIDLLRTVCEKGKCNLAEITWFIDTVNDLFYAKAKVASSTKIVDSALNIDVSLIHDLLSRDEENSTTMTHVSTSISSNRKAFEDFEAEEVEITAAELALQQR